MSIHPAIITTLASDAILSIYSWESCLRGRSFRALSFSAAVPKASRSLKITSMAARKRAPSPHPTPQQARQQVSHQS